MHKIKVVIFKEQLSEEQRVIFNEKLSEEQRDSALASLRFQDFPWLLLNEERPERFLDFPDSLVH